MKTILKEAKDFIGKLVLNGFKAILHSLKINLLKGHLGDNTPITNGIIEDDNVNSPETQSNIQDAKSTRKVKVLIATFSQRGSTKKIADQIAKGLFASNFEVTHFPITENNIPDLDSFDIVGIGSSTYFFRPPFIVQDFIKNLKGLENKSSFVFITYGTSQGRCGNWILRKLKRKGTHNLGYFKSQGADYWIGYIKRGVLFSPDSPNRQELVSAEIFGKTLAERYADNVYIITKPDAAPSFIYTIESMLVARPLAKIYSRTFKADENCNNCGICIQNCPVGNITQNGKITFHTNCILCATCELSCPQDAIHSAFDWKIFSPFMNYNIRHSLSKKIPFNIVIHKNGKTSQA